jgi:hypothetical protein
MTSDHASAQRSAIRNRDVTLEDINESAIRVKLFTSELEHRHVMPVFLHSAPSARCRKAPPKWLPQRYANSSASFPGFTSPLLLLLAAADAAALEFCNHLPKFCPMLTPSYSRATQQPRKYSPNSVVNWCEVANITQNESNHDESNHESNVQPPPYTPC